ncbi:beta-glucuronidase [Maribellus comscasis]|uniref:Beta-glucuronidase n=1 Tax=Maribellus comscasis TaxID=2681766 RepID=A0A6I6K288_9BACT|nr:sugar-binding domain-containing protein [Maribellus comscasis]QGY47568.1 beta-glucuronidase [Maribellus comscasis]
MKSNQTLSFLPLVKHFLLFLIIFPIIISTEAQNNIPRPEHPRPQFMRDTWINLNGQWNFAFDFGKSGIERGWFSDPSEFDMKINVPFCPESSLSGIEYKDFMPAVWYHRTLEIPPTWQDGKIFIHFGAVDFDCRVWVNGEQAGRHYGGNVSFEFDITELLQEGINDLVVLAEDDVRNLEQPAGKQSQTYYNSGCCKYTRTTGIWQTVWLEARPEKHLKRVRIIPDLDNGLFILTPEISGFSNDMELTTTITNPQGSLVKSATTNVTDGVPFEIKLDNPQPWSPENPYLYTIQFSLKSDGIEDVVSSFAGLRKIHIEGNKVYLNNKPIFQRLVLDQGYYPDGILTAPTDEALKKDIELSMAAGFNGARLHEKVFEERFHYWADQLGYLTWGELPDWGTSFNIPQAFLNIQNEWREEILRDMNHPSIIAWTPTNETAGRARRNPEVHARWLSSLYDQTKNLDPTRPVNDASGYTHIKTDLFTIHDYDQNLQTFYDRYKELDPEHPEKAFIGYPGQAPELSIPYKGQPYIVDEYGGTFWLPEYAGESEKGNGRSEWGYGKTGEQVEDLVDELTQVLLNNPNIAGFTYTQLTDVMQEVNGVYTFDRKEKFNTEKLKEIFGAPAAIEK